MLLTSFAVFGETAENQQLMRYFIQDLSLNIKFFYILFCCGGNSSWMATIVSASKNVNTSYLSKICSFHLREKCPNPNTDTFYVVLIWFIFQNAWFIQWFQWLFDPMTPRDKNAWIQVLSKIYFGIVYLINFIY